MASLAGLLTKVQNLLALLNTKTGRSDADLDTAINALPSKKTSDDVKVSGATVTTPSGIYFSQVQKSAATATRAITVLTTEKSNNTLVLTASNPQGTGYVTANTARDTATKTVSLSVSGGTVTASDGTNSIAKTVATGSATTPATTITKNPTITVDSSGLITAAVSGTQSVTPTVSAGYVNSGTAGTITVKGSNTKQLTLRTKSDLTASNLTVYAPAGYYATQVGKTLNDSNLVASNIKSGVSIFGVTGSYVGGAATTSVDTCTVVLDMSSIGAYGNTQHTEVFYTQLQDGIWTNYEIIDSSVETYTLTDVVCGSGLTIRIKIGSYSNESNGIMSNSGNDLFFVTVSVGAGETQTIYFEADD